MKKLILIALYVPFSGIVAYWHTPSVSTNLAQVRSGNWPILLERTINKADTFYSLQFRDEQIIQDVVLDTMPFADLKQLKYFGEALTVLKTGHTGDIAKFKDYSIKRFNVRKDSASYILRYEWSLLNFRQPEADILINVIRGL